MLYSETYSLKQVRTLLICLFFLLSYGGYAQVLNSTTIEVVGSPTWYRTISLDKKGVVIIIKEDQTRFKIVRLDASLKKLWEQDLFLDTERPPAAFCVHEERLALVFSETSGMYYQLLDFNLQDGVYIRRGFEVREFFQDKGLVMFDDKAVLLGTTEKGIAYFVYDFKSDQGELINTEYQGSLSIEESSLSDDETIKLLVNEKTIGYSNLKKKRGEYTKSSKMVVVNLDANGKVISKLEVVPNAGKFPVSGSWSDDKNLLGGIYQDANGEKGFYFSFLKSQENKPVFFRTFSELIGESLNTKDKDKYLKQVKFHTFSPKTTNGKIHIGGIFYLPKYEESFNRNNRGASSRFFKGYEFSTAYIFTLDESGNLWSENATAVNQSSINIPIAINSAGAVAYLSKGSLSVKNFEIGTKPIVYQLSDDRSANSPHVAAYYQVNHWYDNVFLAVGAQSKVEAIDLGQRKKTKRSVPFTQTRRTYFLTSVSAGQFQKFE